MKKKHLHNKQVNKKFEVVDHTADIGLKVWGKNFSQLLKNAACGMYSLICQVEQVEKKLCKKVCVEFSPTSEQELLLVIFLNELLYITSTKMLVFKDFKVKIKNFFNKKIVVESTCLGERYNSQKHGKFLELKAATYHNLKISKRNGFLYTKIFFDV
jgi:SHS2 domain-containing protein